MSTLHRIPPVGSGEPRADVVFVHGLGGDAFKTWRHGKDESTSWPHWVAEEFPDVAVWSLGYAASWTQWAKVLALIGLRGKDAGHSMALPDRGVEVLEELVLSGLGQRPIVFVCHSLGGLVVKQMLRMAWDSDDARYQAISNACGTVFFLATPHTGAGLADVVGHFKDLLAPSASIADLRQHDPHLRDLATWYSGKSKTLNIETITYYEGKPAAGALVVVDPSSSNPNAGRRPVPLDECHVSISKPASKAAKVCRALVEVLSSAGSRRLTVREPHSILSPATHSTRARAVPKLTPPRAQLFVGRADERRVVAERLRAGKSTAVVGSPGIGKTALAAEVLADVFGEQCERVASSQFPDGVVYADLYAMRGQAEQVWSLLANELCGPNFLAEHVARVRAKEACRDRQVLLVLEGAEEADGSEGRSSVSDILSVLGIGCRYLALTRRNDHEWVGNSVKLNGALSKEESYRLLDSIAPTLGVAVRKRILRLLKGHPLALCWAGNMLARGQDTPEDFADEWEKQKLPKLNHPTQSGQTLEWLFGRSVRGLDDRSRRILSIAGALAHAPVTPEHVAVGAPSQLDLEAARVTLRGLVGCGLMLVAPTGGWQFSHVLGHKFAGEKFPCVGPVLASLGSSIGKAIGHAASTGELGEVDVLLQHAGALVARGRGTELRWPLVNGLIYEWFDRLEELGRLDLLSRCLGVFEVWIMSRPKALSESQWRRETSIYLGRVGDVKGQQGDLAGAAAAHEEALRIMRELTDLDPQNSTWQRDLTAVLTRVGSGKKEQGDLAGASSAFEEALWITRERASRDPKNPLLLRDVMLSLTRVGGVKQEQGDLAGASSAYEEALAVARGLTKLDSGNTVWRRDAAVGLDNIGEVKWAQGDLAGAMAAYEEALQIMRELTKLDPQNTEWRGSATASLDSVGRVKLERGDLTGTAAAYEESLETALELTRLDPRNAAWRRSVAVSMDHVGRVKEEQGDLVGAAAAYDGELRIMRELVKLDPQNAAWLSDVAVSLGNVGRVKQEQKDLAGATVAHEESLEIARELTKLDPSNAEWRRNVAVCLYHAGRVKKEQGDLAAAAAAYEEEMQIMRELANLDPQNTRWRRDVAASLGHVGQVKEAQEDWSGATFVYAEALQVWRELAKLDSRDVAWRWELTVSLCNVGRVKLEALEFAAAAAAYGEALQIRRALVELDTKNLMWRSDLSFVLAHTSLALGGQGSLEEALTLAEESLEIEEGLANVDPANTTWKKNWEASRSLVTRLREKLS